MAGPPDNKSIRDFFKPARSTAKAAGPANPGLPQSSPNFGAPLPTRSSPSKPKPKPKPVARGDRSPSTSVSSLGVEVFSSGLSQPSSNDGLQRGNVSVCSRSAARPGDRVIQDSDEENEDSESSLEDLRTILATKGSKLRSSQTASGISPSTPVASRYQKTSNFHTSPMPVLNKYKFDMESLVEQAKTDEAIEASSKRVKAMLDPHDEEDSDAAMPDHPLKLAEYGTLLESILPDTEDGNRSKFDRALQRTEALTTEKYWYFFDMQADSPLAKRTPFPASSVPRNWRRQLLEPGMRNQCFISGFAEDKVAYGQLLPDELFNWILDEVCLESSDPLWASYVNVLIQSPEQVGRLVTPKRIEKLFRSLGGTPTATNINKKITSVEGLPRQRQHTNPNRTNVVSVITFLGRSVPSLQQSSRIHLLCLLLRMSIDPIVVENVDIFELVQGTIGRLCQYTSREGTCDTTYQEVCRKIFTTISQPSLRLRMVEAIPSTRPSSHDLRRRLAMCFHFEDLAYSKEHSHILIDLDKFISRLDTPDFEAVDGTGYREIGARVILLDIAADDGLSVKLNLSDAAVERSYNGFVDELVAMLKDVMKNYGGPRNHASIYKLETKGLLDLVGRRIEGTLRTMPKPTGMHFETRRVDEDLEGEKNGMASFLTKLKKGTGKGV